MQDVNLQSLEAFFESLLQGFSIASPVLVPILFLCAILLVVLIYCLLFYLVYALPAFLYGKKIGSAASWIAWIPVFGYVAQSCFLCETCPDREFVLFGKFRIRKRRTSLLIYVLLSFGVFAVIFASMFLPSVGTLLMVVSFVPLQLASIVLSFMDYVYLRDALDRFDPDRERNRTTAIFVTLFDAVLTGGLIRTVWLCTLLKKDLLPEEPAEAVSAVQDASL